MDSHIGAYYTRLGARPHTMVTSSKGLSKVEECVCYETSKTVHLRHAASSKTTELASNFVNIPDPFVRH